MSITGLIARRGSPVTVRRGTDADAPDATARLTWADVGSGARMFIEPMTADLAQRVWGQERQAALRGAAVFGADIAERDGIKVTAGDFANVSLRVVGAKPWGMGSASKHLELALERTAETFA